MTDLYSASIDDLENVIRFLFQQMRDNPWKLTPTCSRPGCVSGQPMQYTSA